jgi:hypothetical protein
VWLQVHVQTPLPQHVMRLLNEEQGVKQYDRRLLGLAAEGVCQMLLY